MRFGEQIAERYSQVHSASLRPLGWVPLTPVREENGGPDGPISIRHGLAVDRYSHWVERYTEGRRMSITSAYKLRGYLAIAAHR
ncbi:hypothetical protein BQ8794_50041 [Mesorhizobium prunaredense]|uniref:Uncharacterized protein n=1 Tax=Mesorhizobium prunaredense TaxID=1631249 RepID=A0A1R3VDI4_9HYPH|nr:hypothetical protein BQ8794_50041 [Mesorhizobium prunaredense]